MSNLNNLIPLADKHRTTTQMSLQTPVDNLNIVCYPEQLELFTGDIDETVELENEAISMISEEDMFVWMEVHTEKEGKTHFDFTVVVTKNMGKRRRQRINHILKALHILFRKEDAELFKRNVKTLEKSVFANLMYKLHRCEKGMNKEQYGIDDIYTNMDRTKLEIFLRNDGKTEELQYEECKSILLDRMQATTQFVLQIMDMSSQLSTVESQFPNYRYLDEDAKNTYYGLVFNNRKNSAMHFINYNKWSTTIANMSDLMDRYGMQKFVDALKEYDILVNPETYEAVLIDEEYDKIALTYGSFMDLDSAISELEEDMEDEKMVESLIDNQLEMNFEIAQEMDIIKPDVTIIDYDDNGTKVDVKYASDESVKALFDMTFYNDNDWLNIGKTTISQLKEQYDFDELHKHYHLVVGTAKFANGWEEDIAYFEKDNGTYYELTKEALYYMGIWMNRYNVEPVEAVVNPDMAGCKNTELFVNVTFCNSASRKIYRYICEFDDVKVGDHAEIVCNGETKEVVINGLIYDTREHMSETFNIRPESFKSISRIICPESNLDASEPSPTCNEMSLNNGFDEKSYHVKNEPVFDDDECPFH